MRGIRVPQGSTATKRTLLSFARRVLLTWIPCRGVDLILLGPKEEWCNLLAEANRQLGQAFLEKSEAVGEESETAH